MSIRETGVEGPVTGGSNRRAPRTAPVGGCPLCSRSVSVLLFRGSDRLHDTPGIFTYRRCGGCGSVFQDPMVVEEDLPLCYPVDYYTHEAAAGPPWTPPAASRRWLSRFRDALRQGIVVALSGQAAPGLAARLGRVLARSRRMRERAFYDRAIDELLPRGSGRRALDVGCGSGVVLRSLREVGWEAEGVEWDPVAATQAETSAGCTVHRGDFRQAGLPLGAYDLVVLHHVFEHLRSPVAALDRVAELLTTHGRAVFVYPNIRSLGARVFGSWWFPLDTPRHLVLAPLSALSRAAERRNLMRVTCRTTARFAAQFLAHSRDYRAGRGIDQGNPRVSRVDRLVGGAERLLSLCRLDMGEEAIAVFRKVQ